METTAEGDGMTATANGRATSDYATGYRGAGLSIVPIRNDGSKAATVKWSDYQRRLPTDDELRRWFIADNVGLAIIYGSVSGNAELIDLDNADIAADYREAVEAVAPGLLAKLCIIQTPRPGFHLVYRCEVIEGNQKLAQDEGAETLIETRGQGGYALAPGCPPACHPTGRTYEHEAGPPLTELPTITADERETLLNVARSFNRYFEHEPQSEPAIPRQSDGLSPGDDYNGRATWPDVLTTHGWSVVHTSGDKTYWRRPGKSAGWSATTGLVSKQGNELFCVFSTSANPFPGAENGRQCSTHSKFDAYARLNHNGDHSAAAKQLAGEGYGEQSSRQRDDSQPASKNGKPDNPFRRKPVAKFSAAELITRYPKLAPPVIDGIVRQGETINTIAPSKVGKSWFGYGVALSIVTGRRWLDQFDVERGRVLIVDNELHRSVLANRLQRVGESMELFTADYGDRLDVWCLRGELRTLAELSADFEAIEPGRYRLIILDALYRFCLAGVSENDNAAMAATYNMLDQFAAQTRAALMLIHHSSKGSQADRRTTDVGAGAGAQSRAADTHLVLREHLEPGVFVLDGAVRSFPPVEPFCLRWDYPLWHPAYGVDPEKLKGKAKQDERQAMRDREGMEAIIKAIRDHGDPGLRRRDIRDKAVLSKDRADRLLGTMARDGHLIEADVTHRGNQTKEYRLPD
ncbi:AAA family ATPase [Pirellulales bacterium]|nr:AAA family ATPase [Pirellulales bacterium]